jgi:galactonate dehydratase
VKVLMGRPTTSYEVIHKELETSAIRAAVNMALLDIVGKSTKVPVYRLLGGPTRNKARAMSTLNGSDGSQLVASLRSGIAAGYRAFVVPLPVISPSDRIQKFVGRVRSRIETLRAAAGDRVDFVLDAAGALSPREASILCSALERFHLLWLDEPVSISNLSALAKLTVETVIPLGFGRDVTGAGDFQNLLREQVIDVLRPSLPRNGITAIRRMAAIAETNYVAVAPHHDGGPIATAAALHLAASLSNFFIQQIPAPEAEEDRRMRAEITPGSIETVKEGFARLPQGCGLGVEVNIGALQKYREHE